MYKLLKASVLIVAGAFLFSFQVHADDVYNACINAVDPMFMGAEQEKSCQCSTDAIGRRQALQEEFISLCSMTFVEREGMASKPLSDRINDCWSYETENLE